MYGLLHLLNLIINVPVTFGHGSPAISTSSPVVTPLQPPCHSLNMLWTYSYLTAFAPAVPGALDTSLDTHMDPSPFQLSAQMWSQTIPECLNPNSTLQSRCICPALFCNTVITTRHYLFICSPSVLPLGFSSMLGGALLLAMSQLLEQCLALLHCNNYSASQMFTGASEKTAT